MVGSSCFLHAKANKKQAKTMQMWRMSIGLKGESVNDKGNFYLRAYGKYFYSVSPIESVRCGLGGAGGEKKNLP
jgi:hypothetical protein